jgi:hypothetical protein
VCLTVDPVSGVRAVMHSPMPSGGRVSYIVASPCSNHVEEEIIKEPRNPTKDKQAEPNKTTTRGCASKVHKNEGPFRK